MSLQTVLSRVRANADACGAASHVLIRKEDIATLCMALEQLSLETGWVASQSPNCCSSCFLLEDVIKRAKFYATKYELVGKLINLFGETHASNKPPETGGEAS